MKATHILAAVLTLTAVHQVNAQSTSMPMKAAPAPAAASMPLVAGEIRKLDPVTGLIVLKHEDIPNLGMPGMTMGFDVADKKILDGLNVGDKVRFRAEMLKGKAMVTELKASR
ncbi:MAG: copper-binding protein [Variovorax sp.]